MTRAGFIGTGAISRVHLDYLEDRDDVEIVGLCDTRKDVAQEKTARYGGTAYTDYRDMLDNAEVDAVWLCTPPSVRREPLLLCAERGIPVLCEKPVSRDLDVAREIDHELSKHDACVQVGYPFRTMPVVSRLTGMIADDTIYSGFSFYGCPSSIDMGLRDWIYEKDLSGGGLLDQATHVLDLMRLFIGEVESVQGFGTNPFREKSPGYTIEEVISLNFKFAHGAVGSHVHSWLADGWRVELALSGQKRFYRLDLLEGVLIVLEDGNTHTYRQDRGQSYAYENARFLEMVEAGDWAGNPCSFADGVKTLDLTLRCDAKVEESLRGARVGNPAG